MNVQQIQDIQPKLGSYLREFHSCFLNDGPREHLLKYVEGQLSELPRKSVEPIALKTGVPPRTLQEFLSLMSWDHDAMADRIEQRVAKRQKSPHSVGVIDDTGCPKKGTRSPGVQRQWCGATGKVDNCQVSVHLNYTADDFHCLLPGKLYVPESWSKDRERCKQAGIPDDVVYRPKWEIALGLFDRAVANGIKFHWLTFDEAYGGKPEFLKALEDRQQPFVGEVPVSTFGWIDEPPAVTMRPYGKSHRRRPRNPRVVAGEHIPRRVEDHLKYSSVLKEQPWVPWRVKDGTQGPMVWEAKHCFFYPTDERELPGKRLHLLIARNVLCPDKIKYFVSNGPERASIGQLLIVGLTRWTVERCFEDEKMELGFDHFEGRKYQGLQRHQTITALTHLFLAEIKQQLLPKKNPEITLNQLHLALSALFMALWVAPESTPKFLRQADTEIRYYQKHNAKSSESHIKRTIRRLHEAGIKLKDTPQCQWDTS